ncbi:MAG: nucleoside phosphorylase [Cytophagales bacterium]|nr:nucleoside phosphorylase [Cytophagales bacterium]
MNHFKSAPYTTFLSFWTREMIYFDDCDQKVALVGNFGIGGQAAAHMLEILIAAGTSQFIVVGHAGGLHTANSVGNLVLTDKAVRDEGLSHHYLPSDQYAYPSKKLSDKLKSSLAKQGIVHHIGSSWTLDSMYRETKEAIQYYANEGVATVEMELASLFAVAAYRDVAIASLLVINDYVTFEQWNEHLHAESTGKSTFPIR